MKAFQMIKSVNNTELGKSRTHETYILVPQELDISMIFPTPNELIPFYDPINKKTYDIRLTIGREKRIVGLGKFYRDNDAAAGDDIILKKTVYFNSVSYQIICKKHNNSIFISKLKEGFELLTPERISLLTDDATISFNEKKERIELVLINSIKKRKDSPNTTDIYDLRINNTSISNNYNSESILELVTDNNEVGIVSPKTWKKLTIESED